MAATLLPAQGEEELVESLEGWFYLPWGLPPGLWRVHLLIA